MLIVLIKYGVLSIGALLVGYIADLIIGDPYGLWHPVQGIGWFITAFEKMLRKAFGCKAVTGERTEDAVRDKKEFIAGILLVILVITVSTLIPLALLFIAYKIYVIVGFVLEAVMCYALLATKALKAESMKVYDALKKDGLEAGRKAVSMIVGRDTQNLTETGVVKAAVETIAENTADGVIAPMFYMVIGGPCLGFFYKAVNTMDSMVGYKNDKYLFFGRAAAKTDDVLNFIPARISAWLMIFASGLCKADWKNAVKMFHRDRYNHASPNSAQTEAVMAGALDVQLAGDAWYFGKLHKKKTIGDSIREIELEDIPRANRLLYASSLAGIIIFSLIKLLLLRII